MSLEFPTCCLQMDIILLLPFWFGFLVFVYLFACLISMATYNTMVSSIGRSGHPCIGSDFRGKAFDFSLLSIMSYMAFIIMRYVPSTPNMLKAFIMKDVVFCQIFFQCQLR